MGLKKVIADKKIPRNQLVRRVGPGLVFFLYIGIAIFFPKAQRIVLLLTIGIAFLVGAFFSLKALLAKRETSSEIPIFIEKAVMLMFTVLLSVFGGWLIYIITVTSIFE